MKRKITLILLIALILTSCAPQQQLVEEPQVNTVEPEEIVETIEIDVDEILRQFNAPESQKQRIIDNYRNTNFLDGYDETHKRLMEELKACMEKDFEAVTLPYIYYTDFELTPYCFCLTDLSLPRLLLLSCTY